MRLFFVILCFVLIVHIVSAHEGYAIISPENAHQLERVARLGRGYVGDIWYEDNHTLMISNARYSDETWQYNTRDMSAPPIFHPSPYMESLDYVDFYPVNDRQLDGIWHVEREGIRRTLSDEIVLEFSSDYGNREWYETDEYIIVWQGLDNRLESNCAGEQTLCRHRIIVFNTRTQTVFYEFYRDDIVSVQPVLDDTHLAIAHSQGTDFYHLSSNAIQYNFSLPATIRGYYLEYDYAISYDYYGYNLTLWNLRTRSAQLQLQYPEGEGISGFHLSEDGRFFAIATTLEQESSDWFDWDFSIKNIEIWDLQSASLLTTVQAFAPLFFVEFSDDGQYFGIFTQTYIYWNSPYDNAYFISLYETQTGREIARIDNNLGRSASDMAFSPDNRQFAISFRDGRIIRIDTLTGEVLSDTPRYGGYVHHIFFDKDHILSVTGDGYVDFWDMDTLAHVRRVEDCFLTGVTGNTGFCNDAWAWRDSLINSFIDMTTFQMMPIEDESLAEGQYFVAAISPDEQQAIITFTYETPPEVWDIESEELVASLDNGWVREVQYLADGTIIASRSHGTLWDAETFEIIAEIDIYAPYNAMGVYSEMGDWVAFPTIQGMEQTDAIDWETAGSVLIWRLSDWYNQSDPQPITEIDGHGYSMTEASPDGRLLLVGNTLIDMETFEAVHQFPVHGHGLEVEFSPDGRFIIVADGACLICGADESLHIGSASVWAIPND